MPAPAVVLDTNILSDLVHPQGDLELSGWFDSLLQAGRAVVIPAIVDYESRRYLIEKNASRQLNALEGYLSKVLFAPLKTEQLRRAAEIWAQSRRTGRPMTSRERLDGDAILVAQVEALGSRDEIVLATENLGHFDEWIPAASWRDIVP